MSNCITIIGLGAMGTALANALIEAGNVTTVWNRTQARADTLVARGARRAETVQEAIDVSDVIVLCLTDYTAAEATLADAAPLLAGRRWLCRICRQHKTPSAY